MSFFDDDFSLTYPPSYPKHLKHWTQGGTGVTNFSLSCIVKYARAIEEFGDPDIFIGDAMFPMTNKTDRALRVRGMRDLSDFWRVMD